MSIEQERFEQIVESLCAAHEHVAPGKMMSSPGIKYKTKVFAFYHNKSMTFRLGKETDPSAFGVENFTLLNPFKTKGPLPGWYTVAFNESDKWDTMANFALEKMT